MQALRLAAPALALAAVLSSVFLLLGFASASRTTGDAPRPATDDPERPTSTFADTSPADGSVLSAGEVSGDVRGEPVPGLPRCPGSVRVAYSEHRADGLGFVRAGYASERAPDAARDFYAGVFGSGRWEMANVEYTGGQWYLLATSGAREAVVEVSSRGGGSLVKLEVSRPLGPDPGQEDGASAGGSKR